MLSRGPPARADLSRPVPSRSRARQGVTRLLLTRIPFFREVIVSSFACGSCAWANTEIQSAGRIQEQGVRYVLAVAARQVSPRLLGRARPGGRGELLLRVNEVVPAWPTGTLVLDAGAGRCP